MWVVTWYEPDRYSPVSNRFPTWDSAMNWALFICKKHGHKAKVGSEDSICYSRGPRIGQDGAPICYLPRNHEGLHIASKHDGWGSLQWGDPVLRRVPD